ncbi:hypothetical protein [Marinobacter salsuginis]|uniref:hypothetical protein n=1 Tax=Marinobacter salsuginis TaxID=418719 RepID=UPI0027402A2D|nr:hypothetical protein [Marinobacter salsuginis]
MSLQQAITHYLARKEDFESSQARAEEIRAQLLPAAEQGIATARETKSQAGKTLRGAKTSTEVEQASSALRDAEQAFKDAVQLRDNLDSDLKAWNDRRERHRNDVETAKRRMFELKRLEMLDAFTLTADQLEQLEQIIAAKSAASGSPRNGYADPIAEKYGDMEGSQKSQIADALLSEMVASVP